MENFLSSWGTPNRLLQAVLEDITNPVNIAGCKALGLIDKHVTGPLWRLLESDVHVLDVPQHYATLKTFFETTTETSIDMHSMTGELIPFEGNLVKKDSIWQSLIAPSSHDSITRHMLLSLFKAFTLLLDRVLTDLVPVTQAEKERKKIVRAETASIPATNCLSERDFAKFNQLLREKPHASILALEAHILFTNNRTSKWLDKKSDIEKEKLMEEARRNAPRYRKAYHSRISQIEEEHMRQKEERVKKKERC